MYANRNYFKSFFTLLVWEIYRTSFLIFEHYRDTLLHLNRRFLAYKFFLQNKGLNALKQLFLLLDLFSFGMIYKGSIQYGLESISLASFEFVLFMFK